MTTSAFAGLTAVETAFKTIVWDNLITAGELYLDGQVLFLALPVIKQASDEVIQLLTDALYTQIVLFVDISAIKLVNDVRQSAWSTANEALSIIAQEKGINSDEYKQALSKSAADFALMVRQGS